MNFKIENVDCIKFIKKLKKDNPLFANTGIIFLIKIIFIITFHIFPFYFEYFFHFDFHIWWILSLFLVQKNNPIKELLFWLGLVCYKNYLRIFVTEPAPTVLPPSRIENLVPSSTAIGAIKVTVNSTFSPGITISRPGLNLIPPVTSVVRK